MTPHDPFDPPAAPPVTPMTPYDPLCLLADRDLQEAAQLAIGPLRPPMTPYAFSQIGTHKKLHSLQSDSYDPL
eukprot:1190462-Prorocentrum_minimum.AAC.3